MQQERTVSLAVQGQHVVLHVQHFCTLPRPASWPSTDCGPPPSSLLPAASSRPRGSVDSSSDQPRSAAAETGCAAVK
jgi:hypothetical protein